MLQCYLLLLVGLGGCVGALLRYVVVCASERYLAHFFAYSALFATLCVNAIGSFLAGVFLYIMTQNEVSPLWRVFFSTGFLGGFTTFSAFSLQNFQSLESSEFGILALNIILNVGVCLFAVWGGFCLAKISH